MMMVSRMVEQDWVQLASDWKNATLSSNESARKSHKKEIFSTEESFGEGKQKRLRANDSEFEIQMRIHNQNHIICTPFKSKLTPSRRLRAEIERKTEKFSFSW